MVSTGLFQIYSFFFGKKSFSRVIIKYMCGKDVTKKLIVIQLSKSVSYGTQRSTCTLTRSQHPELVKSNRRFLLEMKIVFIFVARELYHNDGITSTEELSF